MEELKRSPDETQQAIGPGRTWLKNPSEEGVTVYEADPKLDRTILWKRDLVLIPIMGIMYTVLFLDRTNIANAKIEGLVTGLNMPSNGYNVCLSVFYIPFVLAEVPSNLMLERNKFKPAYLLGAQMFCLGILGFCQSFVKSYGGLIALRFLLGTFKSSLPAAGTHFIATYYTKKEAGLRFAFFFNFALAGPLFSGLLAYAIENLDGVSGLSGWRWIFLIEGLMTVFMSFIVFIFCPNLPHEAQSWFLKPYERERLLYNLEQSRGKESTGSAIDNVPIWKILLDWRIHLFTMCFFCCDITASSVAGFAPTILKELGWTAAKAQLMTMPIWGVGIVSSFTISVIAPKVNFRTPFMLAAICFQLIGWGILKVYPPSAGIRYMALFFLSFGTYQQMPTYMAWLAINLRGNKYLAVVWPGWLLSATARTSSPPMSS